jgi:PEP-CTERM motif
MPVTGRRPLRALVVLCSLACISLSVNANSVPVSGTAYGGNDSNGLTVTAGNNVSIFSASPIGYSEVGGGTAGVPITVHFWVLPWSGPGYGYVTVGNRVTDIVDGAGILFTGTFTVPSSAIAKGSFDVPVSVAFGQLSAWQDLTYGQSNYTTGPLMANLLFNGTGVATLDLIDRGYGQFQILDATFKFHGKGDLTVVPEPGSLFLVGIGLVGLGIMLRRKRWFRPST